MKLLQRRDVAQLRGQGVGIIEEVGGQSVVQVRLNGGVPLVRISLTMRNQKCVINYH